MAKSKKYIGDRDIDDPIRNLVRTKLKQLDISAVEASRKVGRTNSYLSMYLTRGIPKRLGGPVRYKLARLIGVEESELRTDDQVSVEPDLKFDIRMIKRTLEQILDDIQSLSTGVTALKNELRRK